MADVFSKELPELLVDHYEHLLKSAISQEVMRERGYRSILGKAELEKLGFSKAQRRTPGILIPLYAPDGSLAGYQYRPDDPRLNAKGKPIKYENPPNSAMRLDMPPRCAPQAGNPATELWFTEGAKKADALATKGLCAINLTGVWGFKGKNEFGATTLLADFDLVALKGRVVYLVFDSDVASNPMVRLARQRLAEHLGRKGSQVSIIPLPGAADGKKQGVDDFLAAGHTVDELRGLAKKGELEEEEPIAVHSAVYCVHEGQFCLIKNVKDVGKVKSPLSNFTAQITDEVILDDGIQESRHFIIEGSVKGSPLPRVEVPASDFHNLGWVTELWGTRAVVYAGSSTKDHLRTIIQIASNTNSLKARRVFTHTGWRVIDGERFFLTASGALGRDDVEVSLGPDLNRYRLPLAPAEVPSAEAMKASLRFLEVGNRETMTCLWAAMFLSPLCEVLDPAFTLWLSGPTGSFKSVLSALALSHFGDFTYLTLPASWRDTANRLEFTMSMLKDLPLVIDDWHPAPTVAGARELEAKAEIVIRGQGNRAGRGRLRADASPREKYTPRGMVISTGEQLPGGESGGSRLFVVELEKDQVTLERLSKAQQEARLYPYAMAHYILWLRENWQHNKAYLLGNWPQWRDRALSESTHPRLPAAVAWLYAGFDLAMMFATEVGAVGGAEVGELCDQAWESLLVLSERQGWRVDERRPAKRFLDAFSTLLVQQRIFLITKEALEPMLEQLRQGRQFVGWLDGETYYLLPAACYTAIFEFHQKSPEPFTIKSQAVWADLERLGLLKPPYDKKRLQHHLWFGAAGEEEEGRAIWVVPLKRSAVEVKSEKE